MQANTENDAQSKHWPCLELKRFVLHKNWTAEFPKSRIFRTGYQKTCDSLRALFFDKAYDKIYDGFQDYCFQQGEYHNANSLDKAFFESVLYNDLIFWLGDKDREVRQDFPLDPKVYDCFGHMSASHFDVFTVRRRSPLGAVELESKTTGQCYKAWAGFIRPPQAQSVILARLMPLNFQTHVLKPWLTIPSDIVEDVMEEFIAELAAMKLRFEQCSAQSLLKIGAYHLYEAVAARIRIGEIQKICAQRQEITFNPRLFTYIFPNPAQIPKLSGILALDVIDSDLATCELLQDNALHKTLREAIVSRHERSIEIVGFLEQALDKFVCDFESQISKTKFIKKVRHLNIHETYRSIRHI